jgi:hypothetical protein
MSEIKPEVVERMAALVRELAAVDQSTMYGFVGEAKLVRFKEAAASRVNEARAITELLPAPVDPDLIEARRTTSSLATAMHTARFGLHSPPSNAVAPSPPRPPPHDASFWVGGVGGCWIPNAPQPARCTLTRG